MMYDKLIHWCASLFSKNHVASHKQLNPWTDPYDDSSAKPDWLVLFMSAVFLLTLLIAWLVDIPALLR
jgi:hypothetical protein